MRAVSTLEGVTDRTWVSQVGEESDGTPLREELHEESNSEEQEGEHVRCSDARGASTLGR